MSKICIFYIKNRKNEPQSNSFSMVNLKRFLQTSNKTHTTHLITTLKPYKKTKAPVRGAFE